MLPTSPRLLKVLDLLKRTEWPRDEISMNRVQYTKNPIVINRLGHLPDKGFDTLVISMNFGIFLKTESYEDEYGRLVYYNERYPIPWDVLFVERIFEWFLEERLVYQAEQEYKEQQTKRYWKKMAFIRRKVKEQLEKELNGE